MTVPIVDIQTCVYVYMYIYIYTHAVNTVYILFPAMFITNAIKSYDTSIVFGTVHSTRTVIVMVHKHFSCWCSTFFNFVSIIMNYMYTTISESRITAHVNICSTFSSWLIMSNLSYILIIFRQFFTWIALVDVDLHFSLILIMKANAAESYTSHTIISPM